MGLSEAFGFEERWLRLLLKIVPSAPLLLSREHLRQPDGMSEAQYNLGGIGNRQVLALRDWALGMGILIPKPDGRLLLSDFGALVNLYDPELEEFATFWAIHHRLCVQESIWFYGYYANTMQPGRFSRADLRGCLAAGKPQSDSVLDTRTLPPLLQTMSRTKLGVELGLLAPCGGQSYERRAPDPSRLSPTTLAYLVVDWCRSRTRTTVNVRELLEPGAPGRYLGLAAEDLSEMLRRVQDRFSGTVLTISHTAGLNSVAMGQPFEALALLECEYLARLRKLEPPEALRQALELTSTRTKGEI